jgi:hypothetical protein
MRLCSCHPWWSPIIASIFLSGPFVCASTEHARLSIMEWLGDETHCRLCGLWITCIFAHVCRDKDGGYYFEVALVPDQKKVNFHHWVGLLTHRGDLLKVTLQCYSHCTMSALSVK